MNEQGIGVVQQQFKVTDDVSPSELARAINRLPHFRAVVWGRYGRRRVYIKRYRFMGEGRGTDRSLETEFTIYVEFKPGSTPVLTVKEADLTTKDPQWECTEVSRALSREGIHLDCKAAPHLSPCHYRFPVAPQALEIHCDCLVGGSSD